MAQSVWNAIRAISKEKLWEVEKGMERRKDINSPGHTLPLIEK
jgi:hypothetical protein